MGGHYGERAGGHLLAREIIVEQGGRAVSQNVGGPRIRNRMAALPSPLRAQALLVIRRES